MFLIHIFNKSIQSKWGLGILLIACSFFFFFSLPVLINKASLEQAMSISLSIAPGCHPPAGGSDSKYSVCNTGDQGLIPGSERSPGEGNGNPFQHSCLENPTDRGAWWATVYGVSKSQTRLSDWHWLFPHYNEGVERLKQLLSGPKNLKYLLSIPLQPKFTNYCTRAYISFDILTL